MVRPARWFTRQAWWVHVLVTLGAVLLLVLAGLGTAAGFFVDFVNEHGPLRDQVPNQTAPPPDEARALAEKYAPVLKLDSQELFVPIRQAAYVGKTRLKVEEGRLVKVVEDSPSVDRLISRAGACQTSRDCQYFLDVRDVEPDPPRHREAAYAAINRRLLAGGEVPTVYAHVTRYDDSGEYALQYWFLYLFNYRLNEHESDWEQITLRLDSDKQPIDAFYSQHNGGLIKKWSEVEKDGDHPVDYPARGSHANYFAPGKHKVTVICKRLLAGISTCFRGRKVFVDVTDGRGTTLRPGEYRLANLAGPIYIGSYGSGNYVVLTRKPDVLADPRTRPIWADPLEKFR